MDEILKLDFLTEINYLRLFIDLIILFVCSKAIEYVYKKYGYSNDNKLLFTNHMFPFLIAIFLIVSVIKSSIALSLGLVGALSIIRFRTAIKEPGQLITLLIMTSLAISMAAEKELLGIIVTIIYCVHSIFFLDSNKYFINFDNKILRVSIKQNKKNKKNLDEILLIKNFERVYEDVNKDIIIEISLTSDHNKVTSIINEINKFGAVNSYEIF
tara:strand:- start:253 stop:891 length:639 start_codon:yes stop_codon:yes gene_type:complete